MWQSTGDGRLSEFELRGSQIRSCWLPQRQSWTRSYGRRAPSYDILCGSFKSEASGQLPQFDGRLLAGSEWLRLGTQTTVQFWLCCEVCQVRVVERAKVIKVLVELFLILTSLRASFLSPNRARSICSSNRCRPARSTLVVWIELSSLSKFRHLHKSEQAAVWRVFWWYGASVKWGAYLTAEQKPRSK